MKYTVVLMGSLASALALCQSAWSADFAICKGASEEGTEVSCAMQDKNGNPLTLPEHSIGAMYGSGWRLIQAIKSSDKESSQNRKVATIFYFDKL
jgi:hypothetical protein